MTAFTHNNSKVSDHQLDLDFNAIDKEIEGTPYSDIVFQSIINDITTYGHSDNNDGNNNNNAAANKSTSSYADISVSINDNNNKLHNLLLYKLDLKDSIRKRVENSNKLRKAPNGSSSNSKSNRKGETGSIDNENGEFSYDDADFGSENLLEEEDVYSDGGLNGSNSTSFQDVSGAAVDFISRKKHELYKTISRSQTNSPNLLASRNSKQNSDSDDNDNNNDNNNSNSSSSSGGGGGGGGNNNDVALRRRQLQLQSLKASKTFDDFLRNKAWVDEEAPLQLKQEKEKLSMIKDICGTVQK